jgi:hypothetical protein
VGVIAATIFGLGIGGYFASKKLYGPEGTEGHKFINEVQKPAKPGKGR